MTFTVTVNGQAREVDVDDDTPLLWVLRDEIKLSGTKFGCGIAMCGACTVHVGGQPVRACAIPIAAVTGPVVTIEGAQGPESEALRNAWVALDVPQCGYCQSGQLMSAIALLREVPVPTDEDVDLAMNGNICRCATYVRIRAAIHQAAHVLDKSK